MSEQTSSIAVPVLPAHPHGVPPTPAERRHEFLYHVLPAWLSAIGAIGALVLTAYTLLVVHETSGQVHDIMNHMGILPPAAH